jgi:hypothetical protein
MKTQAWFVAFLALHSQAAERGWSTGAEHVTQNENLDSETFRKLSDVLLSKTIHWQLVMAWKENEIQLFCPYWDGQFCDNNRKK